MSAPPVSSDGLTIGEALSEFEARGYVGQLAVRDGGVLECTRCHATVKPSTVPLDAARRVEGVSDPADMVFIGAARCPRCGEPSTLVIPFGPYADADQGRVLRELHDERESHEEAIRAERDEHSLVRDTGWLPGPD